MNKKQTLANLCVVEWSQITCKHKVMSQIASYAISHHIHFPFSYNWDICVIYP